MDKLELVLTTMRGGNHDEIPVSLWKHFPYDDLSSTTLAKAHIDFAKHLKIDLLKISPHSRYCMVDWGLETSGEYNTETGSMKTKRAPIETIGDWESFDLVDPLNGEFGKQIKAVKLITKQLEDCPKMMTIFSPLMIASKLDPDLFSRINSAPKTILTALDVISDVMIEFGRCSLDAGAEGLFLATQHAGDNSTDDIFNRFDYPYLNNLMKNWRSHAIFTVLHLHGDNPRFKILDKLKPEGVNWHDQVTSPSLSKAYDLYRDGALFGGLNDQIMLNGDTEELEKQLFEATEGLFVKRLIIAPGCVLPQDITIQTLQTLISIVKKQEIMEDEPN